MAVIRKIRGKEPQLGKDNWLADNTTIIGDVTSGDNCTFWFNAVVRGDVNSIELGNNVNVQDNAVIHCTYQKAATKIGDNVSIGHNANVHGCTIHDNVLVGMGAIVMDNCEVHSNSVIAAGAVVLENTVVEPNSVYAGIPAKKVKELDADKSQFLIERTANNYVKYASWYQEDEH